MSQSTIVFGDRQKPVAEYFARNFGKGGLNLEISRECQMYRYGFPEWETDPVAAFNYFNTALQQMHAIDHALEAAGRRLEDLDSMLDFAAGFGRLTRFLIERLPAERVWVSDIQPSSMDFQRKTFGVHAITSAIEPDQFQPGRKFRFIFVASLFSHLPRERFDQWLRRLWELLEPDGVLAFSVLDRSTSWMRLPYTADGFTYHPEISEIEMLPGNEYGSSIVTEHFVAEAIERATGGKGRFQLIPRGLWHQDLYLVRRGEEWGRLGWGIMDSYFPISVANNHVFGSVYGTLDREVVRTIEVLLNGKVARHRFVKHLGG